MVQVNMVLNKTDKVYTIWQLQNFEITKLQSSLFRLGINTMNTNCRAIKYTHEGQRIIS